MVWAGWVVPRRGRHKVYDMRRMQNCERRFANYPTSSVAQLGACVCDYLGVPLRGALECIEGLLQAIVIDGQLLEESLLDEGVLDVESNDDSLLKWNFAASCRTSLVSFATN